MEQKMIVEGGTIRSVRDTSGNIKHLAVSEHENKRLEFWSIEGATYWLWAIDARVRAYKFRTGQS